MTTFHGVQNRESLLLDSTLLYAVILGTQPSRGARSPKLWNAAFEGLGLDARMHPMDVRSENLEEVIEELKQDSRFIGGAVTTPYKQAILPYLDDIENEARLIGAVNALYRKDGLLIGANTDGAAAIKSLETHAGSLAGKVILLLGLGGAGQAVGIYLARAIGSSGTLFVANRTFQTAQTFAKKSTGFCPTMVIPWPIEEKTIRQADIVVNATTLGFQGSGQENMSPFSDKALNALRPDSWAFDLIYQPPETPFLKSAREHGIQTLNGKHMNLEQAVIAFKKVLQGMKIPTSDTIDSFMQTASQQL